jgi:type II secretory pathway pseudopilin PulG
MTLIELLVAMGIFSILGMTLALFLQQGLSTWRTGEARRELYEEAQSLLSQLKDDLRAVASVAPAVPGAPSRARFLCDLDEQNRQRLTIVRTIAGEARHPLASLAGKAVGADADLDGVDDRAEGTADRLRPTGGLMEVLWAMDPVEDGVLLRGTRAPALPEATSLFALETVRDAARLRRAAHPVSTRVLALEMLFWTPVTRSWDPSAPARLGARPGERSGPSWVWDSTRALLPPSPGARDDEFRFFRGEASIDDPDDDIVPERVRVTLVLREDGPRAPWNALSEPLREGDTQMRVFNASPFVGRDRVLRVGKGPAAEWVRVKSIDAASNLVRIDVGGRGLRGTRPRRHDAGTDVITGSAFSAEVEVPAWSEPWKE